MWKTRLLIVVLAAAAAWGWARASLLPEAVRITSDEEAGWSLTLADRAFPSVVRRVRAELEERVMRAAADPTLREARQTPEAIQRWAARQAPGGADEDWMVISADGIVVARSANAAKRGSSLLGEAPVRELAGGQAFAGLVRFEGAWRLAAGEPLRGPLGAEGALLALRRLDGELLHELAEGTGADLAVIDGERVAGTAPSAALADLREALARADVPAEEAGALTLAGEEWRIEPTEGEGLQAYLMRRLASADDPLGRLGLTGARGWVRPGPVAAAILFAVLAIVALVVAGREGGSAAAAAVRLRYAARRAAAAAAGPPAAPAPSPTGRRESDAVPTTTPFDVLAAATLSQHLAPSAWAPPVRPTTAPEPEAAAGPAGVPPPKGDARPAEDEPPSVRDGPLTVPDGEFAALEAIVAEEAERELPDDAPRQPGPEDEPRTETPARPRATPEPSAAPAPTPTPDADREEEGRSQTVECSDRHDTPTPLEVALRAPALEPADGAPGRRHESIYGRFLECRLACGEPVDDITYERFERRLDRNAEKVRESYACDEVRFRIRIVDGHAKIQATPIRRAR